MARAIRGRRACRAAPCSCASRCLPTSRCARRGSSQRSRSPGSARVRMLGGRSVVGEAAPAPAPRAGRRHRDRAGGARMRFDVAPELELFGESVRAALGGLGAGPRAGARRVARRPGRRARRRGSPAAGWHELWAAEISAPVVAGGLELGRAVAPVCLVDEATLGAPLAVDGRVRHGARRGDVRRADSHGWGSSARMPRSGAVAGADARRLRHRARRGTRTPSRSNPTTRQARWNAWTRGDARLPRRARERRARHRGRARANARAVRRAARPPCPRCRRASPTQP